MSDTYAIPGAALGAKSTDKMSEAGGGIDTRQNPNKTLGQLGSDIYHAAEWHATSMTDEYGSDKYPSDPNASYYGNGALSILDRAGRFIFARNTPQANQAAFKIDASDSHMYSSAATTTLGSTDIDTVDGWILNPLSKTFPSSGTTPTKPWVKKFFPTLTSKSLVMITILELVQFALLKLAANSKEHKSTTVGPRKDMTQIIVDNQDSEDQLFKTILT